VEQRADDITRCRTCLRPDHRLRDIGARPPPPTCCANALTDTRGSPATRSEGVTITNKLAEATVDPVPSTITPKRAWRGPTVTSVRNLSAVGASTHRRHKRHTVLLLALLKDRLGWFIALPHSSWVVMLLFKLRLQLLDPLTCAGVVFNRRAASLSHFAARRGARHHARPPPRPRRKA